jgi:hypothetical protein
MTKCPRKTKEERWFQSFHPCLPDSIAFRPVTRQKHVVEKSYLPHGGQEAEKEGPGQGLTSSSKAQPSTFNPPITPSNYESVNELLH